uniref:Uncharacterized protein n=1 Tax=Opuntia streptacantha TaxID=393608 RepID=A0A7C8YNU0_OPUST
MMSQKSKPGETSATNALSLSTSINCDTVISHHSFTSPSQHIFRLFHHPKIVLPIQSIRICSYMKNQAPSHRCYLSSPISGSSQHLLQAPYFHLHCFRSSSSAVLHDFNRKPLIVTSFTIHCQPLLLPNSYLYPSHTTPQQIHPLCHFALPWVINLHHT